MVKKHSSATGWSWFILTKTWGWPLSLIDKQVDHFIWQTGWPFYPTNRLTICLTNTLTIESDRIDQHFFFVDHLAKLGKYMYQPQVYHQGLFYFILFLILFHFTSLHFILFYFTLFYDILFYDFVWLYYLLS